MTPGTSATKTPLSYFPFVTAGAVSAGFLRAASSARARWPADMGCSGVSTPGGRIFLASSRARGPVIASLPTGRPVGITPAPAVTPGLIPTPGPTPPRPTPPVPPLAELIAPGAEAAASAPTETCAPALPQNPATAAAKAAATPRRSPFPTSGPVEYTVKNGRSTMRVSVGQKRQKARTRSAEGKRSRQNHRAQGDGRHPHGMRVLGARVGHDGRLIVQQVTLGKRGSVALPIGPGRGFLHRPCVRQ